MTKEEENLRMQLVECEARLLSYEATLEAQETLLREEYARAKRWRERYTRLKRVGAALLILATIPFLGDGLAIAQDDPRSKFFSFSPELEEDGYSWKYKEKIKTGYGPILRVCDTERRDEYSIWIFTIPNEYGGTIRVPGGMTFLKNGCR